MTPQIEINRIALGKFKQTYPEMDVFNGFKRRGAINYLRMLDYKCIQCKESVGLWDIKKNGLKPDMICSDCLRANS